ncbi:hypothetical protein ACN2C7_03125 [Caulobacter sp. ErkDOM-E]|jgi:hypothetical protein|uniref:hypothetical protein n=1 Tax=Caulobacter sp. ErkDOM-E TaxID=3402778 RepID=UPI003AF546AF
MDEPAERPTGPPPSPEAKADVSRSDAELERGFTRGLEILERYRKTFEALAK